MIDLSHIEDFYLKEYIYLLQDLKKVLRFISFLLLLIFLVLLFFLILH